MCIGLVPSLSVLLDDIQLPDEETLRSLIRKGTIANAFVPVLCGSAFKNKGVQPLLDAGEEVYIIILSG